MKYILFTCLVLLAAPALAQEGAGDFALKERAVKHAAIADAHNQFCEQHSTLALDFIMRFVESKQINAEQYKALAQLGGQSFKETREALLAGEKPCKDLDVMMQKYQNLEALKDASYRLNGIDPETLPKADIPELENLLPPTKL